MNDRPNTDTDQTTQDVNAILAGMTLPRQLQPGYRSDLPPGLLSPSQLPPELRGTVVPPGTFRTAQADPADPPPATPASTPSVTPGGDQPLASPPTPAQPATPGSVTPGSNAPMLSPTPPIPTLQPPQPPQRPGVWQDRPDVVWQNRPPQQQQIPQQQQNPSEVQQRFISTYGPLAEEAGKALGVDPRLILGQWAFESGWGVGPGAAQIGNMAGIKGRDGQYVRFNSPQEFADAYVRFLRDNPRYRNAVGAGTDANKFFGGLKQAGYFGADLGPYMQGVFRNIGVFGTVAQGQGPAVSPQPSYPPAEPRDSGDWGHPPPMQGERGPDGQPMPGQLPQPSAFGRIMSGLAPLLLAIGSLALRLPLSSAITAYGAMARAQQNGEEQEYQRNRTRWRDQLGEATAQQTLESRAASDAFSEYGHNNPQGLQQQLMRVALQYNDPTMYRMAEQGDLNGIYQMQAKRDALNQDLTKTHKAAQEEADRQAQDAAVKAMDNQWHDKFVADNGREPTVDEAAIAHNEHIGQAGQAGTKTATAGTGEATEPYEVLDKTTNEPTRQVRLGKNGGLFDLDGKPTQLGSNEKLGNKVGSGGGRGAGTPTQGIAQSHLDAADAKTRQWIADEKAKGHDPTPDEIKIHRDQELDKTLQAGRAGGGELAPYTGPATWPGAPNTPPPGDPDITPAIWAQALLLAQKGAPVPLGRNSPAAAAIRKAYPVAQAALGIDPAEAAQREIKFSADKASEVAVSRYFGSGQAATQMRSLNTVAGHINLFRQYAEAMRTGDVQTATKIGQAMAVELGHPEVTDFRIASTLMADEIVRLLTNTGGTQSDRDDMQKRVASYMSQGQLAGAADTIENFMHGRFDALQQEWVHPPGVTQSERQIGERTAQFREMMTTDARTMFERGTRPIQGGDVQPMTEQQYNAAPSGTRYRLPNDPPGTVRVKP